MPRASNSQEFIKKSNRKHDDLYTYNNVNYINSEIKVSITCSTHGDFLQTPKCHVSGKGCPLCAKNCSYTQQSFLDKLKTQFGTHFDYSKVKFKTTRDNVTIVCPDHGEFSTKAKVLLASKHACHQCSSSFPYTRSSFIKKAHAVHNRSYSYSRVKLVNSKTHIIIKCKTHGEFSQSPHHHLTGQGCPGCKKSIGENLISNFLLQHNIKFQSEYPLVKNKESNRWLRSDFFIEEHNMVIEFDGIQHFQPVELFGGEDNLKITQKRDQLKDKHCKKHNIPFIRFRFDDKKNFITERLEELFL